MDKPPFDTYGGLKDGPVTHERLQSIAHAALHELPDHAGIIMIVVPFGDGTGVAKSAYWSTCNRTDSIAGLRAMADSLERGDAPHRE